MINVLYTVNGFRVNGMSTVIMQYILGLDKNEYKFFLFTDEIAPQFLLRLEENGVIVINSEDRGKNQIAYYLKLVNVLKKNKVDILHAHGNSATLAVEMLAAKRCGVPVRIAHSHNTTCVHKFFDKLLRPIFYKTNTHGIGCGVEAGKWLFGNREHVVVKNGIDLKKFTYDEKKRDTVRKNLRIDNKYVIGHIGRFTDQKNHIFLINIFKTYSLKNENAVLLLVGDGPLEDEIKQLVETEGLTNKVIFYGTIPDTSSMYSAMDIFIFPSKFEGVPLTLIEAQANGLPELISDQITDEVILTDLLNVISLNNQKAWIMCLDINKVDRRLASDEAIKKLEEAGFGAQGVVNQIDLLYKNALG